MAYTIPQPIKVLPGGQGLQNLASYAFEHPKEGRRYIPVEADWDGNGTTFQINVNGLTTQPFSQVVMLDVDNSMCGAEVTFYFADSSDTLVIPALSAGLFPVFTGAFTFYVAAPAALASDVTRFRILNYRQEPVALPPPVATDIATGLNITTATTTAIIPPGTSGTLVGYTVNFTGQSSPGSAFVWTGTLKDHATGNVLDQASAGAQLGEVIVFGTVMDVSGIAIRFASGIDFVTTFTDSPDQISANVTLRYRTP